MNERVFDLTAAVVFLLIAAGHLLRVVFDMPFVVYDISVPMWASIAAVIILGFLSYEGFHLARRISKQHTGT